MQVAKLSQVACGVWCFCSNEHVLPAASTTPGAGAQAETELGSRAWIALAEQLGHEGANPMAATLAVTLLMHRMAMVSLQHLSCGCELRSKHAEAIFLSYLLLNSRFSRQLGRHAVQEGKLGVLLQLTKPQRQLGKHAAGRLMGFLTELAQSDPAEVLRQYEVCVWQAKIFHDHSTSPQKRREWWDMLRRVLAPALPREYFYD